MTDELYSLADAANILSVSKETLRRWDASGKLVSCRKGNNYRAYTATQLDMFEEARVMFDSKWEEELNVTPIRPYTSIELFAGAGGLALGLEHAGFDVQLLNEFNHDACNTLRYNRPNWSIVEDDISQVDFKPYHGKIDLVSGGFPCQAFSYAGKKMGFEDARGTLFYEFARAIKETQPKIFLGENVRGLLKHDNGKTLQSMKDVIKELGYTLIEPRVLKAVFYCVPQKRERLFLIGIRNDLYQRAIFKWPSPYHRILNMRDALVAGILYQNDCPASPGQKYPKRKQEIMEHVPQGGYWKDLPVELQKEYMKRSYYLGGGKTGMARRLAWDEPSLTLTCAPAQKQTERCHPDDTRPLATREYARIQTFPDEWQFTGSIGSIYKQIGNAVPVNLAAAVGRALIRLLNSIEK